ncbi:Ubiquitin carboxyl-terminal hydrolase 5, partial [Armadillidium vulgare]
VSPSGWKCSNCDKTDNLWMNLSDGTILCGRRQLDGSGGNNHAVEHYQKTGRNSYLTNIFSLFFMMSDRVISRYPLAVKLGTITSEGKADVFSYDEDDMVIDPNLVTHLSKFGINVAKMEKTEKTMLELEIDYNQRAWEWSRLTESGVKLAPKFGPGYTVLLTVPSFANRFFNKRNEILKGCDYKQAPHDFNIQLSKLADGILSWRYSKAPSDIEALSEGEIESLQTGLSPLMFRTLVGKGHPEFSTKRQQDAMEFLEHLLKLTARNSNVRNSPENVDAGHCFKFEYDEQIHSKIPFTACLSKLISPEEISANSSAVNRQVPMQRLIEAKTFLDILYLYSDDWQPVKYDVSIDMPDSLDLSSLRGYGLQPDEEVLPETTSSSKSSQKTEVNEEIVQQLVEMGFPTEACRKAVRITGNWGTEAAMNWIMEHMDDPDFAEPLPTSTASSSKDSSFVPDAEGIAMLMSMGFTTAQATLALKETQNNLERAADWIFSHQPELDALVAAAEGGCSSGEGEAVGATKDVPFTNGEPKYELVAFVSHMGTSIFVGHYVCHIKKDGEWVLFNDEKVYKSECPPKDLGYIYLYKRVSQ